MSEAPLETPPRRLTAREALIAQLLQDVDGLLTRVEALPKAIGDAEGGLKRSAEVLDAAADRYRGAATTFSEAAREGMAEYARAKAAEAGQRAASEARAAIAEAAHRAASDARASVAAALEAAIQQATASGGRPTWTRLAEHLVTALAAAVLTAGLVVALVR